MHLKKLFTYFVCSSLIFVLLSCSKKEVATSNAPDMRITEAIDILQSSWKDFYNENEVDYDNKYLEIINTRIINIKENTKEQFENIDYIVEFELLSNVWNSSPYYVNRSTDSTVIVYLDGTKEISKYNPFNVYFSTNYTSDFSDIIESVEDYHGEYDQILDLS